LFSANQDADYICNWMGNKAWLLELEWAGREEFNEEPDMVWSPWQPQPPPPRVPCIVSRNASFSLGAASGHVHVLQDAPLPLASSLYGFLSVCLLVFLFFIPPAPFFFIEERIERA
jgi:cathepsin A (carboxypeptidase C)